MKSPAREVAANVATEVAAEVGTEVVTELASEVVIEASVLALAGADFSVLAQRFCAAGFAVALPVPGVLSITHPDASSTVALGGALGGALGIVLPGALRRARVLLSVGIHGDETAPIEVLAHVLDALSRQPDLLAVDLMVCVGNLDAIHAGRRFIDADLNRMFRPERGALADSAEAARADALIAATLDFFAEAASNGTAEAEIKDNAVLRWHLDLHTAIRPSLHPTFAIVPELIAADAKTALAGWLGQAGVEAIVVNPTSAGTYSHFSAQHCASASATVELGRVGVLGQNDLHLFAPVALALTHLLKGSPKGSPEGVDAAASTDSAESAGPATWPVVYTVAQQIIKRSAAFSMAFDAGTPNFTALPAGSIIATDGVTVHRVGEADEMVVFPNPDVQIGLRAALMVRR